jgi:hypothetical protein
MRRHDGGGEISNAASVGEMILATAGCGVRSHKPTEMAVLGT